MFTKFNKEITPRFVQRNEGIIRYDLAIQRNEVWDLEKKSLFIHSLIVDYPVPPIYAIDNGDDQLWVLDGKQRLTTCLKFIKGEFALGEDTPSVITSDGEEVEIAGMTFENLPDSLKEDLSSRNMTMYQFRNMTDDEISEMFLRLNGGLALTKFELTRVMAGSKIMQLIQDIGNEPFFKDAIAITENARRRFTDEELIFQILALLSNNGEAVDLSGKNISSFALDLKENGVPSELEADLKYITEYLNKAFVEKTKCLKKINIPMVFTVAKLAVDDNVEPERFEMFVKEFFANLKAGDTYRTASSAGSAKKENVARRLAVLTEAYKEKLGAVALV